MIMIPGKRNKKIIERASSLKKIFTLVFSCILVSVLLSNRNIPASTKVTAIKKPSASPARILYDSLKLVDIGLSRNAYDVAIKGYDSMRSTGILHNDRILSIVDFSLPSFKKRLFIFDIATGKLLYNTYVSHGRNSGNEFATKFSNEVNSFQSSLGFYVTGTTYFGHNGYSLRLGGIEKGINDNAFSRGIVIHAASYVYGGKSDRTGHAGRSEGCPAIPVTIHRAVIALIKNGSCFFIYGTDKNYVAQSRYMRSTHMG